MSFTDQEYFEVIEKNETVKSLSKYPANLYDLQNKQIALKRTCKIFLSLFLEIGISKKNQYSKKIDLEPRLSLH